MAKYRAIVSINFDDDDIEQLAEYLGVNPSRLRPDEIITGELDNLNFGMGWVEQIFKNGKPTISYLSGGIEVLISDHD